MVSSLNRKLLRDVLAMRGQAIAVAAVVAVGIAMYVMYLSNFDSLLRTQQAFYAEQRFADVFMSLERAPLSMAGRIAELPGVTAVETRVTAMVTLDLEGVNQPATGLLSSIPVDQRPEVNDLFLRDGRWIDGTRLDEVLASEGFFDANGFVLGDTVGAVINGRLRRLTIVGVALSPEHIYSIPPGEIIPDDSRFGILWMERRALASAFDMEGGFNDVVLQLAPEASSDEVIARLDDLLEPYGALGAVPRALQLSHWTIENELRQLQNFGLIIPVIFLMVAAFILNVALTRALALQRTQIAALKALGYDNFAIGWHYIKWALIIGLAGAVLGIVGGAWVGGFLIELYNEYFRFPVLLYRVEADVVLTATAFTLVAAALGAFSAVRRAVRIPPAEAMRPEAPSGYRRSAFEALPLVRSAGMATRMVVRNLLRHPLRAAASISGIGFGIAILMMSFSFLGAIDSMIATQFWEAERQNVTVNLRQIRSADARYALMRLPGVVTVEPQRTVSARIRAGHRHRALAITGISDGARLRRIVDRQGAVVRLPTSGLVLSRLLGEILGVAAGDTVTVEVLEGARPVRELPVAALVDDLLGLSAYMRLPELHAMLRESSVVSGALLLVDPAREDELAARLKRLPAVAGAGFKATMLQRFRDVIAANMDLSITINLLFAGVIAFGVVYNAARVSLSERSRELASLRVLGFTRAEISFILLGELAAVTLVALPVGTLLGYLLTAAIVPLLDSEVYRIPLVIPRQAIGWSATAVLGAAAIFGLLVRRKLDRLDLVGVLKIRE